jgi:hypothetical protein
MSSPTAPPFPSIAPPFPSIAPPLPRIAVSVPREPHPVGGRCEPHKAITRSRTHRPHRARPALARYVDATGRAREVVARGGFAGSVIVLDRDAATLGDRRLVAHLGADEPSENATLVVSSYLDHLRRGGGRCRAVTSADFRAEPYTPEEAHVLLDSQPVDGLSRVYRLERVASSMTIPELRWRREAPGEQPQIVSVRESVAALQTYEPICAITARTLALSRDDGLLSTVVLRSELARVQRSPIVLNRKLREVTLACMQRDELSLSEIAIRCGRVKREGGSGQSGETSWLARRLGLLPEGGKDAPTPWIHSDTLALIARRGLGLSPREVETD